MSAPAAPLGAAAAGGGRTRFLVWAPRARTVDVHLVAPRDRVVPMAAVGRGYYEALVEGVAPGARYLFRLDGARASDPSGTTPRATWARAAVWTA